MSDLLPTSFSTTPEAANFSSECTGAQVQELNDVKKVYKIHYEKYNKCKILYEAVQETAFDSNYLEPELKTKVKDILLEGRCAQVMHLDGSGATLASNVLLGLTDLNVSPLHYHESVKLKKAVERMLEDQYNNICEQFYKIFGESINIVESDSGDFLDLNLCTDDQIALDLKGKLEQEQKKYVCNLLEVQRIMQEMVNLRLEKVPQICKNKLVECQAKSQMSSLQSKIVQEKTRVDIFTESSNSLQAYEELLKDIKTQQEECHRNIKDLKELKEKYKQVAGKQYDEILKSFIQYKSALAKKKMLYELQC